MWPNERLLDLLQIEVPIIQAPMAGANGSALAISVSEAGGLGSLPCAMLNEDKMRAEAGNIRQQTANPFSMNFFCHTAVAPTPEQQAAWTAQLTPFYTEYGLDPSDIAPASIRRAFDEGMCELVEDIKPNVVSFHFGLPDAPLLARVKAVGTRVISSATTVNEARWLEANGCDAIIAQGYEAGGHRGMFLTKDITAQAGTMALLPQVVDAVKVPVIAAGGIADGRGIAAAFALGASGVQIGTAYLFTPQSLISDLHRAALHQATDDQTVITNVFSGKPARGLINRIIREVGPMSEDVPPFPTAGAALAPLKAKAEEAGSGDFTSLWSGQAASLARDMDASELTRTLASDALQRLQQLAGK
ncbi:NAD(P)H-dependent flavin oxidoreductase [Sneathiella sp. HT1-7]|uniref:NAD(P)H-dependent flavin oxidoreductase n=1 Tax=Sneathiella sp. HT1-7 TaxID=2887192 RepID=UPI001D148EFE|nr:nitronate monooxygenase [Sneathiella sp. HT1-7]MCC3304012.1 nitronate monooxygenase [Sneathiella sp. HT1-7]